MLGLSAMLSLNYVLPLLNTSVSEYLPFHTHLLIGGSAADRAWLLIHHQHHLVQTPATTLSAQPTAAPAVSSNDTATTPALAAGASVISGGSSLGEVVSLGAGGALLADFAWPAAQTPLALWALLVPAALLLLTVSPPPPDRPPRPA